ncbi:hypothetical protein Vafri_21841 [Volvox africanus]|uniref:Uncharacterized protein n=1 Tax=Volvox africanus TaxID=51714 RepID=A0A8J4BZM3_9CHLO|nr:hypothetical protein Vafri_21841 [Volvox africanus]
MDLLFSIRGLYIGKGLSDIGKGLSDCGKGLSDSGNSIGKGLLHIGDAISGSASHLPEASKHLRSEFAREAFPDDRSKGLAGASSALAADRIKWGVAWGMIRSGLITLVCTGGHVLGKVTEQCGRKEGKEMEKNEASQ